MAKRRPGFSEKERAFETVAIAERNPSADAKGSINLRIESGTRQLIDEAAALLGKTRTEFMIDTARRQAIDVLLDRRLFVLGAKPYDSFLRALDKPAPWMNTNRANGRLR